MNSLPINSSSETTGKATHSLGRSLILWFILLALIPMTLTAWLGYKQAVVGLTEAVSHELEKDARDNARFIQNWFEYRFMDLNSQAGNLRNAEFLTTLKNELQASGQPPQEFVKSSRWGSLVEQRQQDLINFSRHYDYIYDLFLIDDDGNILFSIAREADLGTNLFSGPYATTLFSATARATLESGHSLFSDLEHYAPSNDMLTGFLTAPMLNEQGSKKGLFAIQIRLDQITELMLENRGNSSLAHYLVGHDGRLRTSLNKSDTSGILNRRIDTEQVSRWHTGHNRLNEGIDYLNEVAFEYQGPNGQQVVGIHHPVILPGVNWGLISEIDSNEAFAPAHNLGLITLMMFLLTSLIVTGLAIFQARRITRPIIQLADASLAVAAGATDQHVTIKSDNEIGILADAFNYMNAVRLEHELAIEQSSLEIQEALIDLDEQKFALDQHAIVAITDEVGTINFVNDKFSEITGYSRDELIGQNHRIINSGHHDKTFFQEMYRTISSGKVWHGEICNRNKKGYLYWVDTTIVPFMDDDGTPESYIAIRTDITERKQVELELVEAKEAAEAATQQKSEFLANMSHEIRTPMNGIIGMSGLLLDTRLTSKQRSYATATMKSADALLTIINDILDFSKIEAGKLELEVVPFDLQSLAEDVAELMALKCREKGVEMLLSYKPDTARYVIGDPGRIRQILLNLLSNAVKFTDEGTIVLTVAPASKSALHSTTDDSASFQVSVTDSGIGIAQDKLSHVFNKFDQEDSSTTRKYGGTGLGLTICQQLCAMMHGDISVESEKGKGSTFSFTMRLEIDQASPQPADGADNHEQLNGLKALIVDDIEISRTIISEQLSTSQLRLSSAACGKQAIQLLQQAIADNDPFNIVITDYYMPEMDGKMLAKRISELNLLSNGVMLFITSSPQEKDRVRLKSMGFDGYLTKPTHPAEILQILDMIWRNKQENRDSPIISRHMLLETRSGGRQKPILKKTQILLADDNPINITVATEMLERYGCTVTPAGNGIEALALVKQRDFDLIFMDCLMPEMDGFEATSKIRTLQNTDSDKPRTPIIAFTANAMKSDREKCMNAGMDDYISKPVHQESIEEILINWLPHKVQMITTSVEGEAPQEATMTNSSDVLDYEPFNRLKTMFGDKFPQVIEQHTQNARDNINRVEEAIDSNDLETLERAAHSLKGASAQFGATQLNKTALAMETLAKDGALDNARTLFAVLKADQQQTAEMMLQEISETTAETT